MCKEVNKKNHSELIKKHIVDRLEWVKKYMPLTTELTSVFFSNWKRFNLDGPDGIQYYWHRLKQNITLLDKTKEEV